MPPFLSRAFSRDPGFWRLCPPRGSAASAHLSDLMQIPCAPPSRARQSSSAARLLCALPSTSPRCRIYLLPGSFEPAPRGGPIQRTLRRRITHRDGASRRRARRRRRRSFDAYSIADVISYLLVTYLYLKDHDLARTLHWIECRVIATRQPPEGRLLLAPDLRELSRAPDHVSSRGGATTNLV